MTREEPTRHKARFFGFLSIVWCFVSIPCLLVLFPFPAADPEITRLCILLCAPHPVFIGLAIFLALTEQPRGGGKTTRQRDDSGFIL